MTKRIAYVFATLLAVGCGGDDNGGGNPDSGGGGNPDSGGPGETTFQVTLTREAEVPVCAAAGANATGTATVTISADNTTITAEVTHSGLSGEATAAHIHAGATGASGPPIFAFTSATSPIDQTFTAADYPSPPPEGAPADFAAAVTAVKEGGTYINVHTAACGPGEIRAQIE